MTNFEKVGVFMKTFGQDVKQSPSFSTDKINQLRISLIKEELNQLIEAINKKDIVEFDGKIYKFIDQETQLLMLNKPEGVLSSNKKEKNSKKIKLIKL